MTQQAKLRARAIAKGIEFVDIAGEPYAQVPFRVVTNSPEGHGGKVFVWNAPLATGPTLASTIDQLLLCGAVMPNDDLTNFQGVGRLDVLITVDHARHAVTLVERYSVTFDSKRKNALALQAKPVVVQQKSTWTDA